VLRSGERPGNAGISPNNSPVTREMRNVNARTRQSSVIADPLGPMRGILTMFKGASRGLLGYKLRIIRMLNRPSSNPTAPPATERITLSVSRWRIKRVRLAPNAARIPISHRRPLAARKKELRH